jgi:hypothetical protein
MPRYFTLDQAERKLPEVERLLRDALYHKAEAQKAHDEFEEETQRIRMSGGVRVDHSKILAVRSRRDTSTSALQVALEGIGELGAQVKDLEIGLIDFLSLFEDREVCLCWKLGESGIGFWHSLEDGFRGRKPVDDKFRAGHRGDRSH